MSKIALVTETVLIEAMLYYLFADMKVERACMVDDKLKTLWKKVTIAIGDFDHLEHSIGKQHLACVQLCP